MEEVKTKVEIEIPSAMLPLPSTSTAATGEKNESAAEETKIKSTVEAEGEGAVASSSSSLPKRKKPLRDVDGKRLRMKRRKIKIPGAPKMPLTGYVRYMNSRREFLKQDYPDKPAIEYTKIIGIEWNALSDEKKAPYLADAEIDRQRYILEINKFLKDRPDVLAQELAKDKKRKSNSNAPKPVLTEKTQLNGTGSGVDGGTKSNGIGEAPLPKKPKIFTNDTKDIPKPQQILPQLPQIPNTSNVTNGKPKENAVIQIFTDDFLEHNKITDLELRTLRKSHTDIEMQNSVLEKHIENMRFGLEKMENANTELQEKNRLLEAYLDKLKLKLTQALAGLSIPSEPNGATLDNISKYMKDLQKMATSNSHGPACLNKAKDIIRKLDLHIQL